MSFNLLDFHHGEFEVSWPNPLRNSHFPLIFAFKFHFLLSFFGWNFKWLEFKKKLEIKMAKQLSKFSVILLVLNSFGEF